MQSYITLGYAHLHSITYLQLAVQTLEAVLDIEDCHHQDSMLVRVGLVQERVAHVVGGGDNYTCTFLHGYHIIISTYSKCTHVLTRLPGHWGLSRMLRIATTRMVVVSCILIKNHQYNVKVLCRSL